MTMRATIGAHVTAVFSFQKEVGAFSSADARLARAAVTAFANWLSGLFRQQARPRVASSAIQPVDFWGRLKADVERARRENRGGALAVVRSHAIDPQGAEIDDLAHVLEGHVRGSDTVGVVAGAAAAVLRGLPAGMTDTIADRLSRAASQRDMDVRVNVHSLALSSESSESIVRRALSSTRQGEAEEP
jgi:hypothetical protein